MWVIILSDNQDAIALTPHLDFFGTNYFEIQGSVKVTGFVHFVLRSERSTFIVTRVANAIIISCSLLVNSSFWPFTPKPCAVRRDIEEDQAKERKDRPCPTSQKAKSTPTPATTSNDDTRTSLPSR